MSTQYEIPYKYQKDIEIATNLLQKEGCHSIYLFGSMVTGNIHEGSDIDIGIKGLPRKKLLETRTKVFMETENKIDIVDFDFNNDFFIMLESLGEVLQIGFNYLTLDLNSATKVAELDAKPNLNSLITENQFVWILHP